jgi:CDP-diacylglycerol--glycerol-3-phosphate 3-phosphatidyltransferase
MPSNFVSKIPNILTFVRLGLIPLFVLLLVNPDQSMINAALAVFILAALTDYADGFIARRYKAESDFGRLFDPLADKLLVISALVMLVSLRSEMYAQPWVPGWMVVLVIAREFWVTGIRAVAAANSLIVPAANSGKVKSGLQMLAIVFLLLHDLSFSFLGVLVTCQFVGVNLLLVSIAFSYWGAADYSWLIFSSRKKSAQALPGKSG